MGRHSKEVRSYNMSRIRSTNTKPEEMVRKCLFAHGFRYRKNVKKLPGCPDIVLTKYRTVVLVNGCFWHMHEGCSKFVLPQTNITYWQSKLLKNRERDVENKNELEADGWKVITVWECELKKDKAEETLSNLCSEIKRNVSDNLK
jgi:DNA mismatch endonuclease (patch repair protein)